MLNTLSQTLAGVPGGQARTNLSNAATHRRPSIFANHLYGWSCHQDWRICLGEDCQHRDVCCRWCSWLPGCGRHACTHGPEYLRWLLQRRGFLRQFCWHHVGSLAFRVPLRPWSSSPHRPKVLHVLVIS